MSTISFFLKYHHEEEEEEEEDFHLVRSINQRFSRDYRTEKNFLFSQKSDEDNKE